MHELLQAAQVCHQAVTSQHIAGFDTIEGSHGCWCHVGCVHGVLWLVFRVDGDAWQTAPLAPLPGTDSNVNAALSSGLDSLRGQLLQAVVPSMPVVCVGSEAGGALACLAVLALAHHANAPAELHWVGFGSARAGDAAFTQAFQACSGITSCRHVAASADPALLAPEGEVYAPPPTPMQPEPTSAGLPAYLEHCQRLAFLGPA